MKRLRLFKVAVEILVGSQGEECERDCLVLVLIGEQGLLVDHAEFVNGDAGKVSYFGFAYLWVVDDVLHGGIEILLLIWM